MLDFPKNGVANNVPNGTRTVRFGAFEADLHSGEVRKSGSRVKLQEQPFKVLQVLLERPGDLVTREELRSRIWPEESFGDFDHAVNVAVGKLRTALGDSADNPSFIETVPRRGYRFVAQLECAEAETPAAEEAGEARAGGGGGGWLVPLFGVVCAGGLAAGAVFLGRSMARPRAPEFQRLTVRRGTVYSARFAPDGHGVVYSASWDGGPVEVYSTDTKFSGTRSLGLEKMALLAVSSSGELAVVESPHAGSILTLEGTLGQVPLTGGSPRAIAEDVDWADWAPDGKSLAVVRNAGGVERLEFPVGHVLYETAGWISHIRVSPGGDEVAFLNHPSDADDRGEVAVVDLAGHKRTLSTGWESEEGLAWSPRGDEVLFSATEAGLLRSIHAVDLQGNVRLEYSAPGGVTLEDVAPDGRVLLTRDEQRAGMMARTPDAAGERDLSWLDWSMPVNLSADGSRLVFDEQGEEGGPRYTVAVRDLRGSPPVPLGEGMAGGFSPDGRWVAATVDYTQLVLLPTGAGTARRVEPGGIEQYGHPVLWLADGQRLVFPGHLAGHRSQCFVQRIDGGKPTAVTPEGFRGCSPSPDGRWVATWDVAGGQARLFPVDGGEPRAIPGLMTGESLSWTADPKFLYVTRWKQIPMKVYRLNLATGKREPFKELSPVDLSGLCEMSDLMFSADGRTYVYGFARMLSDLYVVKGLQ
jgi:DNA-binding winged helix-turn-helix (wHTH) protein/Tol biopolymer transport system component